MKDIKIIQISKEWPNIEKAASERLFINIQVY